MIGLNLLDCMGIEVIPISEPYYDPDYKGTMVMVMRKKTGAVYPECVGNITKVVNRRLTLLRLDK